MCAYECENIICNKNKNNLDWFPTLAKLESVSPQSALPNPSGSKWNPSFSLSRPSWLPSTDTHTRTHKAGEFLFCVVNPQSVFDYHRRLRCNSWLGNSFSKGKGGWNWCGGSFFSLVVFDSAQNPIHDSRTCGGTLMEFFIEPEPKCENTKPRERKKQTKIVTSFLCSSTLLGHFWIPYIYIHIYLYIYIYIFFLQLKTPWIWQTIWFLFV